MKKEKKILIPDDDPMKKNRRLDLRSSDYILNLIDELCKKKGINKRGTLIDVIIVEEARRQKIIK